MDAALYIKSLIVGVIIALPLGPVGALSVRRVLSYGRTAGMVSAMGGSLADLVYVVIVRLGLTGISAALIRYRPMLRFVGVALVVGLGIRILMTGRVMRDPDGDRFRYNGIFTSSFFLSVVNPSILFSLTVLFTSAGLDHKSADRFAPAIEVIAVFIGSAACWALMTTIIDRFRRVITEPNLDMLCRGAGGMIILLGLGAFLA
jgi:putative LysE/RhtB family amino acid efflux pump